MLRERTLAAVAIALLCDPPPQQSGFTWLTVLQHDDRRSRSSFSSVSISADGRYVAFASYARLSAADDDNMSDIYVLDRTTMTVTLESAAAEGRPLNSDCSDPSISGDGRYVAFDAMITDVVDVVLRDRPAGTARRISIGPGGEPSNGWSGHPVLDAAGTAVMFASAATNLLRLPDVNGPQPDIYRFDVGSGAIERISVSNSGAQQPGASTMPSVSGDGRYVAFASTAALGGVRDGVTRPASATRYMAVYLRDTRTGRTTLVAGPHPPNDSSTMPVISADGSAVAFASLATNLVARDRNKSSDIFLYDVATGAVTLVSRAAGGGTANGASLTPAISADGRFVAFQSDASDMACARDCRPGMEDINLLPDVFLFDRTTGQVSSVSLDRQGTWMEESGAPAIDATGTVVAFPSRHPVSGQDLQNDFDLFVRATPQ